MFDKLCIPYMKNQYQRVQFNFNLLYLHMLAIAMLAILMHLEPVSIREEAKIYS